MYIFCLFRLCMSRLKCKQINLLQPKLYFYNFENAIGPEPGCTLQVHLDKLYVSSPSTPLKHLKSLRNSSSKNHYFKVIIPRHFDLNLSSLNSHEDRICTLQGTNWFFHFLFLVSKFGLKPYFHHETKDFVIRMASYTLCSFVTVSYDFYHKNTSINTHYSKIARLLTLLDNNKQSPRNTKAGHYTKIISLREKKKQTKEVFIKHLLGKLNDNPSSQNKISKDYPKTSLALSMALYPGLTMSVCKSQQIKL